MFRITTIGNLGADAHVENVNGKEFLSFNVAHTEKYTDSQGVEHENTVWISCALNGSERNPERLRKLQQYLVKGTRVYVEGRGSVRCYSSPKLKQMVAGANIAVETLEFCGGSSASDGMPTQVISDTGFVTPVYKCYYIDPSSGLSGSRVHDESGRLFDIDDLGFLKEAKLEDI